MAIYHMQIKPVTRSTGRTATSAAAYRAGERIRDERTGAVYDHSKRTDVLHREIFLPAKLERSGADLTWAQDRSALWNSAEKAEKQANSRVAREYQLALPAELSAEQRTVLARAFSRELADRYNVAVDLAIHAPRPQGDPRNFHAHLLATTREVTPAGLGAKTGLDMMGIARSEMGLPNGRQEFTNLRARWAQLTNEALREANVEARVDHRTLAAQGIDRPPRPRLPWAAIVAERKGERSEIAERIRERHRLRYAEQRDKTALRAGSEGADPPAVGAAGAAREKSQPSPEASPSKGTEARRQQAVRDWLQYRADQGRADGGRGHESPPPLSMEEIRERAVAAWSSLRARGAESQPSGENRRAHTGSDRADEGQARHTPGLGDDFSG